MVMDREALVRRLMATFLAELDEHVGTLNRNLLALEKDPAGRDRAELLRSAFRAAHSLKGAARSVNVGPIEQACHYLEEILSAARDDERPLEPDLFALLFRAVDALAAAGHELRAGRALAGTPVEAMLGDLESGPTTAPSAAVQPGD